MQSTVWGRAKYVLYHLLQDSKTFPLVRVHQYTSALSAEVSLAYYGRRARQSPRAMAPSSRKKNLGLANPRGGDLYRMMKEAFESIGQKAGRNFGKDGKI